MFSQPNEPSGPSRAESTPRAVLRSLERQLLQAGPVTNDHAYEAQQLVYDAWEATTDARERALIRQALKLDPTNVDALLQAGDYAGVAGEEKIEWLRKIVAQGEKNLGPQVFKEFAGTFWGFIETRPYMRARQRLAEALRSAGRTAEAVVEYQAMLQLNPHDNQGVRYCLLPLYLMLNRLADARKLFAQYPAETKYNAVFAWGRVLERFLEAKLPAAAAALTGARKQNPHLEIYVTGRRKPPADMPAAYAPGSKEEALCFAENMQAAWASHPAALQWLATQPVKP